MADQDKRPEDDQPKAGRRPNVATKLVQIATEMYELRRTADSRGTDGSVVSEGNVYAVLKDDASRRYELADIRQTLAEVYEMRHGSVPARTALGDAMTVLKGRARRAESDETHPADLAGELLAACGVTPEIDEHPGRLKVHAGGRNPFDVAREVADYLLKANEPPCCSRWARLQPWCSARTGSSTRSTRTAGSPT
jgi:hypothetical protein